MAISIRSSCRCVVLLALGVLALGTLMSACNSREPLLDTPVSPSGFQQGRGAADVPFATSTVFAVTFNPLAVLGAGSSRGRLQLSLPAPADGLTVALSSSDPAVSVPSSITVPAGVVESEFVATVQSVPADRQATVAATFADRTVSGTLRLWAVLPTFFSFNSEEGEPIGAGGIRRLTPDNATFRASCNQQVISVDITGAETWRARFAGPAGVPMRTGTWDAGQLSSGLNPDPWMEVAGAGRSCGGTGRFTVHEVQLTPDGDVRRFWATFEQRCTGRPPLRGDVSVTNVARPGPSLLRCLTTVPSPTSGTSATFIYYQATPRGTAERLEPGPTLPFGGDMWDGNNRMQIHATPIVGSVNTFVSVTMAAPRGQPLVPGVYRNARRVPAIGSAEPTLDVSGPSGCNRSTGEFEVLEAVYGPKPAGSGTSGTIQRFRARYRLACDEGTFGISGELALFNIERGCRVSGNC